jgi:hypothetical protein
MDDSNVYVAFILASEREKPSLFDLHSAYRLTYPEAVRSVEYLCELKVVDFDGKYYSLTQSLTKRQLSTLYRKFRNRQFALEESVIEQYKRYSIGINTLYLPDLKRLDAALSID